MTKISVITIIKDDPYGLQDTGNSLAMQAGCAAQDVEWVIIDGSGKLADQVKEVADQFGNLVSIFETGANKGIYPAMNTGLEIATGDWQIYMNAGDQFAKTDNLATVMTYANDQSVDFIYGDVTCKEYRQYGIPKEHYKYENMIACHQSMVFRRDVIGDQRYDNSYKLAGDFKFSMKYAQKSRNAVYIPDVLAEYEGGGISEAKYIVGALEMFRARSEVTQLGFKENAILTSKSICAGMARDYLPKAMFNLMRDIYKSGNKKNAQQHVVKTSIIPE